MPDLDLAKLREQIAREICPEEIDAWNALYASAVADGAYHETAILRADTWHRRGKRSAEKAADRILSLLRPALQAAWEAGREAGACAAEGPVHHTRPDGTPAFHGSDAGNWEGKPPPGFTWGCDYARGRHDAADAIRALTQPDYLTGGDDAR